MSAKTAIRILILARQTLVRAGLQALLEESEEIEIVGYSTSLRSAEHLAQELAADILLIDFVPKDLEVIEKLSQAMLVSGRSVVILGEELTLQELQVLFHAGVKGFFSVELQADELSIALQAVSKGLVIFGSTLTKTLFSSLPAPLQKTGEQKSLTKREKEVLSLLSSGLPNREIARQLKITEHTVKFHVGSLLSKLGATSRTEAVTRAIQKGLLAL